MKKSKKFLLSLGSSAMLSIPLGTVLACGETVIVYGDKIPKITTSNPNNPTTTSPTTGSSNPVIADNSNVALPKENVVSTSTYDYFQYEVNPTLKYIELAKQDQNSPYKNLKPETKMRVVTRIYNFKNGFGIEDLIREIMRIKNEFASLKFRGTQANADINAFPDELKVVFARRIDLNIIKAEIDPLNNEQLVAKIFTKNGEQVFVQQPFVNYSQALFSFDFNDVLNQNGHNINNINTATIKHAYLLWAKNVIFPPVGSSIHPDVTTTVNYFNIISKITSMGDVLNA